MSIVSGVLDEIAPLLGEDAWAVFKSTVPVGSVAKYQDFFDGLNPGIPFEDLKFPGGTPARSRISSIPIHRQSTSNQWAAEI